MFQLSGLIELRLRVPVLVYELDALEAAGTAATALRSRVSRFFQSAWRMPSHAAVKPSSYALVFWRISHSIHSGCRPRTGSQPGRRSPA